MKAASFSLIVLALSLALNQEASAQSPSFPTRISDNHVNAIVQDKDGYMWFGTAHGLNRYDGAGWMTYYAVDDPLGMTSDNINDLSVSDDGRLWIGTECSFIYRDAEGFHNWNEDVVFNPSTRVISMEPGYLIGVSRNGFMKMTVDTLASTVALYAPSGTGYLHDVIKSSRNELWFTRSNSDSTWVETLDKDLALKTRFFIGRNVKATAITEYLDETVIVASSQGIMCFDSGSHMRLSSPLGLEELSRGKTVLFMHPYEENKLLIGLSGEGMYVWSGVTGLSSRIIPEQKLLAAEYVCFVDKDSNIWLSDKSGELEFHAHDNLTFHLESFAGSDERDIKGMVFDNEGNLWVNLARKIVCVDAETGQGKFSYGGDDALSAMRIASDGNIWVICGSDRLVRLSPKGGRLVPIKTWRLSRDIDTFGEMWDGRILLPQFYILDPDGDIEPMEKHPYLYFTDIRNDLSTHRLFLFSVAQGVMEFGEDAWFTLRNNSEMVNLHTLIVASDGIIWYGTYNKGLVRFDPETGQSKDYSRRHGLIDDNVKAIVEDNQGNIWFSTPTRIVRLDPADESFETFFDDKVSGGNSYNRTVVAKGPDGRLYFGGTSGITVVDPSLHTPSVADVPVTIDYLGVNNEDILPVPDNVELNWKQNSLQLRFSALDFGTGSMRNYSYMLDGYDNDWHYVSAGVPAVYNDLPAGKYVFRVRTQIRNSDRISSERTLPIRIKPSLFATRGARILYALLILGLFSAGVVVFSHLRLQRERLSLLQQKEEMSRERVDFITNISHEFRTPLTLIYGPLKEMSKHALRPEDKTLAEHVMRNAERLRVLADQLLGHSGGQKDESRLNICQNDLAAVTHDVTSNFNYAALEKDITITERIPESLICYFDEEKVRKILSNIVNNAVKYTPESGHVVVSLAQGGDHVSISVADDGIGIPEDMRERIFDRFDRLGAEDSSVGGSGVGLNYARNLASVHKGELTFRPNAGKGSVFTLLIPVSRSSFDPQDILDEKYTPETNASRPEGSSPSDDSLDKEGTLMVVEDNAEIREFIMSIFRDRFRVVNAADGKEALDSLKISIPDIVISDVLMPNMNGYELCRTVKEDPDLGGIPIILLTAKSDAASSVEGLKSGADAYIAKPFDPDVLSATVSNLIGNRQYLQKMVLNLTSNTINEPKISEAAGLNRKDKALLESIYSVMDSNLDSDSFTIEDMASEMNISYSSLYAKIKALTGKSPIQFMTAYRMNRAMELLLSGKYTVGEVGYKVGAPSLSTFSRDFKKHYGYSPSSVLKSE